MLLHPPFIAKLNALLVALLRESILRANSKGSEIYWLFTQEV